MLGKAVFLAIIFLVTSGFFQLFYSAIKADDNEFKDSQDVVGKKCSAVMDITEEQVGYVEVKSRDGVPLKIIAKATSGNYIDKNAEALVIFYEDEKGTYLIEPFNH
ncbi:hypothetical protein BKI52_35930 [marine bacterium AO1-C]|nr:hypothetical protein BKI52_35930 [marine bacterium AO1-C]